MAGVTIVRFDSALTVSSLVVAIVAAETTRPVFMANIIRVSLPGCFHFGKEVVPIDFLHGSNRGFDFGIVRITGTEEGGDGLSGLHLIGIVSGQGIEGVGFDVG